MLSSLRRKAADLALADEARSLGSAHALLKESRAEGLAAIEKAVGETWSTYLDHFADLAGENYLTGLLERGDRFIRTSREEYMDRADFPEDERLKAVKGLHQFNLFARTYENVLGYLEPVLEKARSARQGTPRLLDLASGYGGFPLRLAEIARERGIALDISGSDVQPHHVEDAARRADEQGLGVKFARVNALAMEDVEEGSYDVLTIVQAVHHFPPGMLARLIAEASRIATTAFVAVDGVRTLWLAPLVLPPIFLGSGNPYLAHDGIVSCFKFYDTAELELLARAAVPGRKIRCESRFPAYNVLVVEGAAPGDA